MISKNICVGMILTGLVSYFDDIEKKRDQAIIEISQKLNSKLTVFRYGTESFRAKVKKAYNKKKKATKDIELINKLKEYNRRYENHSQVSTDVWENLLPLIKNDKFSINYLIISLLKKHPSAKEYYKISDQCLVSLSGQDVKKHSEHGYAFSSLKVANKILMLIDKEVQEMITKIK